MDKVRKSTAEKKIKKVHPDDLWMNEQYRGISELGPLADAIKQLSEKRNK
jgi:hypothetical protein